jgi:uncharacterized hydrophobic protein (TIGR00341 family)
MSQRVVKIILPENLREQALDIFEKQENLHYWQEESAAETFIISTLTDSGESEVIMDIFEKKFSHNEDFRLIVFPVEASLPRALPVDKKTDTKKAQETKPEKRKIMRISREELYSDIIGSAEINSIFLVMTVISTIVAAIGLLNSNVAVIIGAMVIAPFLGPNVALALSTNLADTHLGINALKTLMAGIIIVVVLSIGMGYFFEANPLIPEIGARTHAGISDIILALGSGCAGVLAFTTGASSAVIGVMVAVAILPPLTVFGMLIGAGFYPEAFGAGLLFLTNIICINLSGVSTLLVVGVSPRAWWQADKAKKATRKALILWSLMLVVLVLIISLW